MTASLMIIGCEIIAMIRKDQVASEPANDVRTQSDFIVALFRASA